MLVKKKIPKQLITLVQLTLPYKGFFREHGSYITSINDSTLRQVSYDSSTVNLFILTGNTSSYTLDRITPVGDTISIQDNFELNENNEFGDTTGGGSSYYHMFIKIGTDSLFVDRVKQSGRPNVSLWEVNAQKLN